MTNEHNVSWPGWEVVRTIGRGSFGAVYEIRRNLFGEEESAALKVISIPPDQSDVDELYGAGFDDEGITATFQSHMKSVLAEYSLMRKMNGHSNIVNCDDVSCVQREDGFGWDIYIKMELLTPLLKSLPAGSVPEETVLKVAHDLCQALVLCKKHDIVHRDIKPQNIFVSPNGDYKLGDFGIAKTVEKTAGGTKVGTYRYMAPEVYNNQPYGSGADIYSLGLVLYQLLNERRLPFMPLPPEMPRAGQDEAARERRLAGEAIPAPVHGSEELKAIVLKACAYDPKERFTSAEEMLAAVKALMKEDEPAAAAVAAPPAAEPAKEPEAAPETDSEPVPDPEPEAAEEEPEAAVEEAEEQSDPVAPAAEEKATARRAKKAAPKKRKPFLWIALAAVAVVLVLCVGMGAFKEKSSAAQDNCGVSGETEKDIYIDIWGPWGETNYRMEFLKGKASEFCMLYEAETGISLAIEYHSQESLHAHIEKLTSGVASQELPVIFIVPSNRIAYFNVAAANLKDLMSSATIEDYHEGLSTSCRIGDKVASVPFARTCTVAYVNKTLLEKSGHTVEELENWTWEDMHLIAKDISALREDVYGHAVYWGSDSSILESALYSNGNGTDEGFDAAAKAVLSLSAEMLLDGSSYTAYRDFAYMDIMDAIYPMFVEGNLGIFLASNSVYKNILSYSTDQGGVVDSGNVVIARQPLGDSGFAIAPDGYDLMISNYTTDRQKEAAAAFLEYLARPENVAAWSEISGYVAITESAMAQPAVSEALQFDTNLETIYRIIDDTRPSTITADWTDAFSSVFINSLIDIGQNPQNYSTSESIDAVVEVWADALEKLS